MGSALCPCGSRKTKPPGLARIRFSRYVDLPYRERPMISWCIRPKLAARAVLRLRAMSVRSIGVAPRGVNEGAVCRQL